MAKTEETKIQPIVHETQDKQLKTEQHKHRQKTRVIPGASEG